jgi:hypothetical protein
MIFAGITLAHVLAALFFHLLPGIIGCVVAVFRGYATRSCLGIICGAGFVFSGLPGVVVAFTLPTLPGKPSCLPRDLYEADGWR